MSLLKIPITFRIELKLLLACRIHPHLVCAHFSSHFSGYLLVTGGSLRLSHASMSESKLFLLTGPKHKVA